MSSAVIGPSAHCAVATGMLYACLLDNRTDLARPFVLAATVPGGGSINGREHVSTQYDEESGTVHAMWYGSFRVDKSVVIDVFVNVESKALSFTVWDEVKGARGNVPLYQSPVIPLFICNVGF